jgi:menaquinone-specific isochorismate synthase
MAEHTTQSYTLNSAFEKQIGSDRLEEELHQVRAENGSVDYLALSISIPEVDVLAVLEQSREKNSFQYYWEKPSDSFAIVACGEHEKIVATGTERYRISSSKGKALLSRIKHISGINHNNASVHLFGGFSFHDYLESETWKNYSSSSFTLPKWMIVKEGSCTILTMVVPIAENETSNSIQNRIELELGQLNQITNSKGYALSEEIILNERFETPSVDSAEYFEWIDSINRAIAQIKKGSFEKVVLARELRLPLSEEVKDTHILNRLRYQYPDCYSFLISHGEESSFIGCTPERLASFNSKYVLTEGLAGSTSRGKTASEDALLEYNLLHSQKDLKEHEIVLDAIEENLINYADRVEHPAAPKVKKLSNVQHLHTPITAHIKQGVSRTEVLKTLHPTPAVGGFPRDKAVSFIKENEKFDRGLYAAPIGWINANGNGEFIVAIRSGLIKNDEVRFFAGCGIVEDSDPQKEWEETNLKFIPMLSALEYAGT